MDLADGNQPLYAEDRSKAIIANGESYNYLELRTDLLTRHAFETNSDTESILHLYEEPGTSTAAALDGMFAFAIADGSDLYSARDPVGIKPLYIGRMGGSLVSASELKALASVAAMVLPGRSRRHGGFREGSCFRALCSSP